MNSSPSPDMNVRLEPRQVRPANKSMLWEDFFEHDDKAKKFFNTKHKKAFCKQCIYCAMREIDGSAEARAEFEKTDFLDGFQEWKRQKAFERVEAISGRKSNMQRHIKTCENISHEDRRRIMAAFESEELPKPRKPTDTSKPYTLPPPSLPDPRRRFSPDTGPKLLLRPQSSSSAFGAETTLAPGPKPRPQTSPRVPISKFLNAPITSEPVHPRPLIPLPERPLPSSSALKPIESPAFGVGWQQPVPPHPGSSYERGLVARLDHAMAQIGHVRNKLSTDSPPPLSSRQALPSPGCSLVPSAIGSGFQSGRDANIIIKCLQKEVEELRKENERLRVQSSTPMEIENEAQMADAKPASDRYQDRKWSGSEVLSATNTLVDEDDDTQLTKITAPRASSAPALFSPVALEKPEPDKKRKLGK